MDLSASQVIRLNSDLFPVTSFEREQYSAYSIMPQAVEVHSDQQLVACVRDADAALVVSQSLPSYVIRHMRRCRIIGRLGAGTDKIDVRAATAAGIVVANVPDFCVEEQADHAFALLLAVARRLNEMRNCMLEARYAESRQRCRTLRRLPGRTLGLVGFGGSAKAVARRARGFGLRVIATRRRTDLADPEAVALGVGIVTLDKLLADADFVSLHLPLDDSTRRLFDRQALGKMKPGSVLINTARGAIVDENALADSLEAGHLAGAGLDTFDVVDIHSPQPQVPAHRLFQMENVVFTPHVAAFAVDSSRAVVQGTVENLVAVLSGHWPRADRIVNSHVVPRCSLSRG